MGATDTQSDGGMVHFKLEQGWPVQMSITKENCQR